jgi:hypothetical protein
MRHAPFSLEATVRAYREATAHPADGAATRARVLARAGRAAGRRAALRRTLLPGAVALLVLGFASVAWTVGGRWLRPSERPAPPEPIAGVERQGAAAFALRDAIAPPAAIDPPEPTPGPTATPRDALGAESHAYGRAHRAHFVDDAPARALAAWNDYLAAYPRGVFAPEARYNRALCLIRLGRYAEAERALGPFARGRPGAYRRDEALRLLDWMRALPPRPARPDGR